MAANTASANLARRGLRLVRHFVRLHPGPFSVAVAGAVAFSAMAVASTVVLGWVTDDVLVPAFESGVSTARIWGAALAILGVALVRSVGVVVRRYSAGVLTRRGQRTLRTELARHYTAVPLDFFRSHPTGELLAHADTDVEVALEAMNPLPFAVGVFFLLAFSVTALVATDPVLAAVGFVLFPLLALVNRYYTRRVERPAAAVQERIGRVSAIAHESFEGALVVKALGLEHSEVARLRDASDALRDARVEVGRLRATFEPMLDGLPNLGIIAVLLAGGWRVDSGAVSPGDLVQVMALFSLLVFPMRVLGYLLEEMPRSVVALDRLDRVLADRGGRAGARGTRRLTDGPLDVVVDGVRFAYVAGEPVLDGCSLTIAPGETVALVGATGGGKSTLCELVAGLMAPDAGTIRLGGVPLAELDPAAVRGATALVFQESFLFADSVAANIAVGSTADRAAVERAARIAAAHGFVCRLPQGYDTVVGERGVTLSGGQRQRVALARALVRNPRVLLLDDATSAVDPVVEGRILDALRQELSMTTLLVAHRLSTIALADRVLLLAGGRIVASGRHDELLAVPEYAAMVKAYEVDAA